MTGAGSFTEQKAHVTVLCKNSFIIHWSQSVGGAPQWKMAGVSEQSEQEVSDRDTVEVVNEATQWPVPQALCQQGLV